MKTVKKADSIKRVSDKDATEYVQRGWSYAPKWENVKPGKRQDKKKSKGHI